MALALAILAFVIQIILFIAQAGVAATQQREFLAISSDTKSALSELQAHTLDTNKVVATQFDKMLDRFVLNVKDRSMVAAGDEGGSHNGGREELLVEIGEAVADLRRSVDAVSGTPEARDEESTMSSGRRDDGALLALARSGPSPTAFSTIRQDLSLRTMSEAGVELLADFGLDLRDSAEIGIVNGFGVPRSDAVEELEKSGLISVNWRRVLRMRSKERRYFAVLTDKGRLVASLTTCVEPPPEAAELFPWLIVARQRVQQRTDLRASMDD